MVTPYKRHDPKQHQWSPGLRWAPGRHPNVNPHPSWRVFWGASLGIPEFLNIRFRLDMFIIFYHRKMYFEEIYNLSICIWWFLRYHLIFRRTIDTVKFSAQGKFLWRLWCLRNDSLLWDLSTPSVVSAMGHESCWHPNYTCWPYVSDKRLSIQPFLFLGYVPKFSSPVLTPHPSCSLKRNMFQQPSNMPLL